MSDTLVTVVAIMLAVFLLVVIPLQVTSQRVDTMSKLDVDTITSDFVDQIRTQGALTKDDYYNFKQTLTSTGNTYDVNLEFKILDENPGKKTTQTGRDKIGENVYYSVYTSQIENVLEENTKYALKEGDLITVTVRNINLTIGQQLKNFAYKVIGNDTYTISASKSGMVISNGATSTIIANDVAKPELTVTLRENNANGKIIADNKWTNQNVYIEMSSKDNYNLDLIYFYRKKINSQDYLNYKQIAGNNFTETQDGQRTYQAFWKSSLLEKYSEIKEITIRIDRVRPTINSVTASTEKSNTGRVTVSATDTGGSGIGGYYFKWTDENQTPTQPSIDDANWQTSNYVTPTSEYNNKKCTVWVKDKAGNISESKSTIVNNIIPKVTGVNINGQMIRKGVIPTVINVSTTGGYDFKEIKYEAEDESIIAVSQNNSSATIVGKKAGKTTLKCTITNYDGTTVTGSATITVIDVEFSPNGGTNKILATGGENRLKTTVNAYGGYSKVEYAWSNSNSQEPNDWKEFYSGQEITNEISSIGSYYLWVKVTGDNNKYIIYTSKRFNVKYQTPDAYGNITVNYSTKNWTNQDVTIKLETTIKAFKTQITENGQDWKTTDTYVFKTNGSIFVRFYNEETKETGSMTAVSVTNIDKTLPEVSKSLYCKENTHNSITMELETKDKQSGFSKVIWYYKKSNASQYSKIEDIETEMNGAKSGSTRSSLKTKTFTQLTSNTTYNIYAEVYDVAGNKLRMPANNTVDVSTNKYDSKLSISPPSGTTCIGNKLNVSITSNESKGELSVSSSDTSIATASISGNRVTVKPIKAGKVTITITSKETTEYKSSSIEYTATFTEHNYKTSKKMGEWSWSENTGSWSSGKKSAEFSSSGQYARFKYKSYGTHMMRVFYYGKSSSNSLDICIGESQRADVSIIGFRASANGKYQLWRNGKITENDANASSYENGVYNSYIDWGHSGEGTWTFTVSANSPNTGVTPKSCVRYYCSLCSHYEDRYE